LVDAAPEEVLSGTFLKAELNPAPLESDSATSMDRRVRDYIVRD